MVAGTEQKEVMQKRMKTVDSNCICEKRVARKKLVIVAKTWRDEHIDGPCRCLIGQKRPYVTGGPVAKVQPFSQIKININIKICLDCWHETQAFVPGRWDWGFWERTKYWLFPSKCYIKHSSLFKVVHYLARKRCVTFMLHTKDQTLLLNTNRCAPIVLAQFQNRSLMYIGLEFLFLSCINFYIIISPALRELNSRCQSARLPFPSWSAPLATYASL